MNPDKKMGNKVRVEYNQANCNIITPPSVNPEVGVAASEASELLERSRQGPSMSSNPYAMTA